MQRVEPSACLVDSFRDEACRELGLEEVLVLERIVVLCKWHRARIKPTVDNFGHAVHLAAAVRAGKLNAVDERLVKLDIVRAICRHCLQFFLGTDRVLLAAVVADPYRKRCAPVTVTGQSPVLNILEPVAKTSFADALRDPVDLLIILYQFILDLSHADEPGFTRIVDERCAASPAVRIVMLELRSCRKKISCAEVLKDFRIAADSALSDFLLGRLAAHSGKWSLRRHPSLLIHELDERKVIISADSGVIFTESRSDVNDTGTVCHRDILVDCYEMSFFVLICGSLSGTLVQRLILHVLEILTDVSLKDLLALAENFLDQSFRHNIGKFSVNDLDIALMRVHAERAVGRQGPRCGRPCEEIEIFVLSLETNDSGALFQSLVALSHLVG